GGRRPSRSRDAAGGSPATTFEDAAWEPPLARCRLTSPSRCPPDSGGQAAFSCFQAVPIDFLKRARRLLPTSSHVWRRARAQVLLTREGKRAAAHPSRASRNGLSSASAI